MKSAGRGNPGPSCFSPTFRDTAMPRSRAKSPPTGRGLWIRICTSDRAWRCAWRWSIRTFLRRKATASCWNSWRPKDGHMRLWPPSATGCLATSCGRRCARSGKPMAECPCGVFGQDRSRQRGTVAADSRFLVAIPGGLKFFPQSADSTKQQQAVGGARGPAYLSRTTWLAIRAQ